MTDTAPSADPQRPDFMVLLGLLPPYTLEDIQQSYRQLALKAHPDRGGEVAEFVELRTAYERAKEYVHFRTDKRKWIAARVERYNHSQRVAEALQAMGAEIDFGEVDWLQKSFGDFADLAASIRGICYCNASETDALIDRMLEDVESLRSLRSLDLSGSHISDTGLLNLRHFSGLAVLDLTGTMASNRVLELVKRLRALDQIELAKTRVGMFTRLRIQRILAQRIKRRPVFLSGRT